MSIRYFTSGSFVVSDVAYPVVGAGTRNRTWLGSHPVRTAFICRAEETRVTAQTEPLA